MDATRLTGLCIVYVLTRHVILNTLTTVYCAVMFVENKVFSSERTLSAQSTIRTEKQRSQNLGISLWFIRCYPRGGQQKL